jgi:hypothetical protein
MRRSVPDNLLMPSLGDRSANQQHPDRLPLNARRAGPMSASSVRAYSAEAVGCGPVWQRERTSFHPRASKWSRTKGYNA